MSMPIRAIMILESDREINKDQADLFTQRYEYYYPGVHNYVRYRVADHYAAEDITSTVFEKAFMKLKYYQAEKASFSTWLFAIARNTIIDYYRQQARKQTITLEQCADLEDACSDPDQIMIQYEIENEVHKALNVLKDREREIIVLKFWAGLSNIEIARFVDVSETNAGVMIFRTLKKLRKILDTKV